MAKKFAKIYFLFFGNRQLFHLSKKKIIMEIRVICIFVFGVIDVFLSNVLPLKKHLLFGGCEHRICVQRWNTNSIFCGSQKIFNFRKIEIKSNHVCSEEKLKFAYLAFTNRYL